MPEEETTQKELTGVDKYIINNIKFLQLIL